MPFLAVKANRAQLRAEPELAVWSCGDARKVIPGQPILALIKFPALCRAAADSCLRAKPKLPFRIKRDTQHIFDRPGATTVVHDLDPFPSLPALPK